MTEDTGRSGPERGAAGPTESVLDLLAPRRGVRRVVAGVVLAESLVLLGAAVFLVVELFRETPTETGGAIAEVVIVLLLGLGLLPVWRAVVRADERARIPVVVWQVLQAAAGAPSLSTRWYVAVVLVGAAVVAGVGVLVPGVLRPDVRGLSEDGSSR